MAALFHMTACWVLALLLSACGERGARLEVRQDHLGAMLLLNGEMIHTTPRRITGESAVLDAGEQAAAVLWQEEDESGSKKSFYSQPAGQGWTEPRPVQTEILLRRRQFDPLQSNYFREIFSERPQVNRSTRGLRYVQFVTPIQNLYLNTLFEMGIEVLSPLHHQAVLVRCSPQSLEQLRSLSFVRWAGDALFEDIVDEDWLLEERSALEEVDLLKAMPGESLREEIATRFGKERLLSSSRFFVSARLRTTEVRALFKDGYIQWAERAVGEPEEDMDNVREAGGANFLAGVTGLPSDAYTGVGIRGHVLEGIYPDHPDFAANTYRNKPISVDDGTPSPHGQATYGILFGSGAENRDARGLLPNAQGLYTNYQVIHQGNPLAHTKGTRYELVQRLVNEHEVMFQTASWGYKVTKDYTSRSYEMDAIIFDHDIPITQSAGNTGNRDMRPQAWAKNIITVGAIFQFETGILSDDRWQGSDLETASSIGPSVDGRVKPDLIANYDGILTTSMEGYRSFTGTSAATPIVAGHLGLVLEMWTNGLFGNQLKSAVENRFANRPHFSTVKALMINSARQYDFTGEDADLTRTHQGWGYPDLKAIYERHRGMHVVNEDSVLQQGMTYQREYRVGKGEGELKATMVFADPAGTLMNLQSRVNNLDLKVTAPDGTIYWGGHGLLRGPYSESGGQPNEVDTVENVFVANPMEGWWRVEVVAAEVLQDAHLETSDRDADFALVVSGTEEHREAQAP